MKTTVGFGQGYRGGQPLNECVDDEDHRYVERRQCSRFWTVLTENAYQLIILKFFLRYAMLARMVSLICFLFSPPSSALRTCASLLEICRSFGVQGMDLASAHASGYCSKKRE